VPFVSGGDRHHPRLWWKTKGYPERDVDTHEETTDQLADLRTSARGWHGVQLAVLGFIGLCGVLQGNSGTDDPRWLQVLSGSLVLAALVLACIATALVALAAWPVYGARAPTHSNAAEIARTSGRLRAGIAITFVSVAVTALAASSAWWPSDQADAAPQVEVSTRSGVVLCGDLVSPGSAAVGIATSSRAFQVDNDSLLRVRPVDGCD
jgi:hypothetical protein